ncbi:TRAP transporter small permease subunit [Thiohalocapsa sp.]|uniref:TRAP transporter small permease subunit n=1 Tax=Thiohalocapsa sp. TaxID=2497641 RepID=UPI0025F0B853|nr:TRAP transporter small permease subunit [Thiohalocapsa sp.]
MAHEPLAEGGLKARLLDLAAGLDLVNTWVGRVVAWLALAMVLVTFLVVVLRYGFDAGSIALQESVTYMHAMLFMLGAAYTLQLNGHVRVDIFYQRFGPRGRAWVDLLCRLFRRVPGGR